MLKHARNPAVTDPDLLAFFGLCLKAHELDTLKEASEVIDQSRRPRPAK